MTTTRTRSKPSSVVYRSYLQKGGALVDDMRALVRGWKETSTDDQKTAGIAANALGKRTRARVSDTYRCAFVPRFVAGDPPGAWRMVQPLENRVHAVDVVKPIYYWVTARSERVLYDFVTDELWARRASPAHTIETSMVVDWLERQLSEQGRSWTVSVRQRVARGMLAALRDFGVLEGASKKRIAPIYLPVESFTYLAFALHRLGATGNQLVQHRDWRLFLLPPAGVERLLLEAHQRRWVNYAAAGNIVRIEFSATSWEEMADVIAGNNA